MRVRITREADRQLRRIGHPARRIVAKIEQYAEDPASLRANVKSLKGRDDYRLRVGDYRVIFTIDGDFMTVLAVRIRGEAYD